MNELKLVHDGGFPLKTNDLEWMQTSFKDALSFLVKPYLEPGSNTLVLDGCNWNESNDYISGGIIYRNGELFQFDGLVAAPTLFYVLYGEVEETLEPSGLKVFKDSNTHGVYLIRKVRLHYVLTGSPSIQSDWFPLTTNIDLSTRIRSLMLDNVTSGEVIQNVVIPSGNILPGTYVLKGNISFSGLKSIYGRVWFEGINEGDVLLTLPDKFKPISELIFDVPLLTPEKRLRIKIKTNGELVLLKFLDGGDFVNIIVLDGLTWL